MAAYERHTEPLDSEAAWRALVQDRLRSLTRAGSLVVGVLSVGLARRRPLGVARRGGRRQARPASHRSASSRSAWTTSSRKSTRRPRALVVSVRDEQRALDERVDALEDGVSDAVQDVRQDVRQDVEELAGARRRAGATAAAAY